VTEQADVSDGGPDHTYWCQHSFWKPEDGAGLALGREPRAINPSHPEHCMPPATATRYREILELIRRAVEGGDLEPRFRPIDFLLWTRKLGITIDAILAAAIEDAYRKLGAEDKPEPPRKTDSKMIVTYARAKGWNPLSPGTNAAKSISDDCKRLGLSVSEETVRNRLNEAKETLDLQALSEVWSRLRN
jgi:hypothetical protein